MVLATEIERLVSKILAGAGPERSAVGALELLHETGERLEAGQRDLERIQPGELLGSRRPQPSG